MTVSPAGRRIPPRADTRGQAGLRGLTLLELLLVLALIVALGALVLPSALSIRDSAAWSSQQLQLRAVLIEARSVAIEHGQAMLVQFEDDDRLRVRPMNLTEDPETQVDALIDMPVSLDVPEDDERPVLLAVLLPDGQARVHQPIILQGDGGERTATSIDALTGHIGFLDLPDAVPEEAS